MFSVLWLFLCLCLLLMSHQSFTIASLCPFNINTVWDFPEALSHTGNNITRLNTLFWKEDIVRVCAFKVEEIHVVQTHVHFQGVKDYCTLSSRCIRTCPQKLWCCWVWGSPHLSESSMSDCLSQSSSFNDAICCGLTASRHSPNDDWPAVLPVYQITSLFLCRNRSQSYTALSEEHSISMKSGMRGHLFSGQSAS